MANPKNDQLENCQRCARVKKGEGVEGETAKLETRTAWNFRGVSSTDNGRLVRNRDGSESTSMGIGQRDSFGFYNVFEVEGNFFFFFF